MRFGSILSAAVCLAITAGPVGADEVCCGAKERAAAARKTASGDAAEPVPSWGPPRPWADYNRRIRWHENVEAAQRTAVAQNKMLFVMQVVGNLRDEGC